jgi:hypothetical protein
MRTNEEVKELCIKKLEELIQNIKDDKTSVNYVYSMEVLRFESNTKVVRYSITRDEYYKMQ